MDGEGRDEAGQVWNKLGKEEDGCEEGLQGGDVRLEAKGRECVWGKGRKSAGKEAAAQKVAMGPDWRPPPPPGWDSGAGLLRGKPGFSQILNRKKVDLIWAISKRSEAETIAEGPGCSNRGGRRFRPRIGKAGTPGSEGRWMGGISCPTQSHHPSFCISTLS